MLFRKVLISLIIVLLSTSVIYADNFNVEFVAATEGPTLAVAVSADESTAYIGAGAFFCVMDISDKNDPVLQGKLYTSGIVVDIAVVGDYAYVADTDGLKIISVTDPANPTLTGSFDTSGWARGVSVVGDLVYVADGKGGLCILRFNGEKTTNESEGKLPTTWGNIRVTALLQNYPNPFNPETWIPFQLAEEADVLIKIYDVSGNLIRMFDLGKCPAGSYVEKECHRGQSREIQNKLT